MPADSNTRSDSVLQGHTPAPWEIDSQGLIFHRLDSLTKYVIAEMESGIEANERLILTAPELLDSAIDAEDAIVDLHGALHNLLHIIDYMRCSDGTMPLSAPSKLAHANELLRAGGLDKLREVIAKASQGPAPQQAATLRARIGGNEMADDIDWYAEIEEFDANAANTESRILWLKLARMFGGVAEGFSDFLESPRSADEAMAWAARTEACMWRATGDADAIDAERFIPELRPTPTPEPHHD